MRRALLVGAGGMGRTWAGVLRDDSRVDIAGWCDLRRDAVDAGIEDLHLERVVLGTDFEKLLIDLRPDFVVDVTVPEAHCNVTVTALTAGVPVLGEKPMSDSLKQARKMVQASERSGKLYMVSQSRRYHPQLFAYRELIARTDLGLLNVDFFLGPHFGGFREEMKHPLLADMAIHTFDAARFLCGRDAVSVYCEAFNPSWSWYQGATSANALFEMEGQARFNYRGSWCAEGIPTSWEGDWRAIGPHGTARWDGSDKPHAELVEPGDGFMRPVKVVEAQVDETMPSWIVGALDDFLRALETGKMPMGECHDNFKSLAMVCAAIESADSGQRVHVPKD